ncbi:MAG TPA: hypothetical protein VEV83_18495 [Parafilimonas sp.]|nr:hypothetical protein [Parafilimonas sp.]
MFRPTVLTAFAALFTIAIFAQPAGTSSPDLAKLLREKNIRVANRNITAVHDPQHTNGIHLDEKEGDGVAWLNDISFAKGIIEFDVKGRNMMQQSFVGIAFHGANDSTMDVVYFRPFNFQSPDPARKAHSVQYVSLPQYDWQKLRTEFPGKYEQPIDQSPQPSDWFHVRVVVSTPKVSVYVNNNPNASLVVDQLSDRKDGMIGFWVGNNSDGDFANLKISKE